MRHQATAKICATAMWAIMVSTAQANAASMRAEHLRHRAGWLLSELKRDIADILDLAPNEASSQELDRIVSQSRQSLKKQGYFRALAAKAEPPEGKLTVIQKILYEYVERATAHNPIFENLDQTLAEGEMAARYQAYVKAGRAQEERQAYERARQALEVAANLIEGAFSGYVEDPPAHKPSDISLQDPSGKSESPPAKDEVPPAWDSMPVPDPPALPRSLLAENGWDVDDGGEGDERWKVWRVAIVLGIGLGLGLLLAALRRGGGDKSKKRG